MATIVERMLKAAQDDKASKKSKKGKISVSRASSRGCPQSPPGNVSSSLAGATITPSSSRGPTQKRMREDGSPVVEA
ncbi:hypothetical protein A2U01_0077968, partial [Trifolium medium]|nr:hypothetical protein [Trifolium medium]